MSDGATLVYRYDGSFEGLLCCVFQSFERKELPVQILSEEQDQAVLFPIRDIDTDPQKAERVKAGIRKKMSETGYQQVKLGYLTCHPEKELLILRFIRMGMKLGKKVCYMLTDPVVAELERAVKHLNGEAHQYKGFVRFSVYDPVLAAVIEPKNRVLPLLAPHFCDRYANDSFLIYDKTHHSMLLYRPRKYAIIPVEDYRLPEAETEEQMFRSLWKSYYEAIGIEERENPKCRMGNMQKRYWKYLTELDPTVAVKPIGQSAALTESTNAVENDHAVAALD